MKFSFGKYNGQDIETVDPNYLLWFYNLFEKIIKNNGKLTKLQKQNFDYIDENHIDIINNAKQLKAKKDEEYAKSKMLGMLSQHIGSIGDSIHLENIELIYSKYQDNKRGFWVFKFLDGNNIINCYSNKLIEFGIKLGDMITLDARISSHTIFDDLKITTINYVKNIRIDRN